MKKIIFLLCTTFIPFSSSYARDVYGFDCWYYDQIIQFGLEDSPDVQANVLFQIGELLCGPQSGGINCGAFPQTTEAPNIASLAEQGRVEECIELLYPAGDQNRDGVVDFEDWLYFSAHDPSFELRFGRPSALDVCRNFNMSCYSQ